MINSFQYKISKNNCFLPFHLLYFPIGVTRAVIHIAHLIFLRNFGSYFFSAEKNKYNLRNSKYNLQLVGCDYFKWKSRFLFRDFFVTPISNIPKNYDEYIKANRLKENVIDRIKERILIDTTPPLKPGGFSRFKVGKGCCKIVTEYLSQVILKDISLFLPEVEKFKNGISAEVASIQYAYIWFSQEFPSIVPEALSRSILQVKSTRVGVVGGSDNKPTSLDDLQFKPSTYVVSFEVFNSFSHHQIQMHVTESHTFIVDPNMGLLFCKNSQKTGLLRKIIECYEFKLQRQREIRVDSLELIENLEEYSWQYNDSGFSTYKFMKKST